MSIFECQHLGGLGALQYAFEHRNVATKGYKLQPFGNVFSESTEEL